VCGYGARSAQNSSGMNDHRWRLWRAGGQAGSGRPHRLNYECVRRAAPGPQQQHACIGPRGAARGGVRAVELRNEQRRELQYGSRSCAAAPCQAWCRGAR
jgi:hypothetical protein